ncbi:MAG: toll/interleukin-1 receptor domain-containing protein [Bacteroidales bacterium]|nr:toll/interleukin-1 receptor domain-containing protein [Bacteroidales bacterium]
MAEKTSIYISYSWENDENKGIEDDLNNLCKEMEFHNIPYKRDVADGEHNLCPVFGNIPESEKKIGEAALVLVVLSEKYLKSKHCMNEFSLIRRKGDLSNRVMIIVVGDLCDKLNFSSYRQYWREVGESIKDNIGEERIEYDDLAVIADRYFQNELDDLRTLLKINNYVKTKDLKGDYSKIIEELKKRIAKVPSKDNALESPDAPTGRGGVTIGHNENKGGFQSFGGTVSGNITISNTF